MKSKTAKKLKKYLNEWVVLITQPNPDYASAERIAKKLPGCNRIVLYKDEYILCRQLTKKDLEDEKYAVYLNDEINDLDIEDYIERSLVLGEYQDGKSTIDKHI